MLIVLGLAALYDNWQESGRACLFDLWDTAAAGGSSSYFDRLGWSIIWHYFFQLWYSSRFPSLHPPPAPPPPPPPPPPPLHQSPPLRPWRLIHFSKNNRSPVVKCWGQHDHVMQNYEANVGWLLASVTPRESRDISSAISRHLASQRDTMITQNRK